MALLISSELRMVEIEAVERDEYIFNYIHPKVLT